MNLKSNYNRNQHFALILAAGSSSRMGSCKTTLRWHHNKTLLRYQAEQFLEVGVTPIIVLGSHNAFRRSDCPPGSQIVINFDRDRRKTSSIITGLEQLPDSCITVIISAVDRPRSSSIYRTLIETYSTEPAEIIAPVYRGRSGHPLLFSYRLIPELMKITEVTLGIREVASRFNSKTRRVDFKTPEILVNINTKEDYQAALQESFSFNCQASKNQSY